MISAKIETFLLRIHFKPGIRAAASSWGDKGLMVADCLLLKAATDLGSEGWGEALRLKTRHSTQKHMETS
jgi:L-alanine-DL-glutamate epimerase-like enolase superfamily enzyme